MNDNKNSKIKIQNSKVKTIPISSRTLDKVGAAQIINMINQFVKGRVYVFIDAANILYSQQTLHWRVDYKKLKDQISYYK